MITKEELKYIAQLFSEYMLKEINNDPGYTVKDEGRLEALLHNHSKVLKERNYTLL